MTDNQASPRMRLLFGLVFLAAGLGIILIGAGVIRPDPRSIHAPLWVIACAGAVFALAGAVLMIGAAAPAVAQDGSLPESAPWILRLLQYALGLLIVAGLATVGSWIAFGPGERHITSTTSFLGMTKSGESGEFIGRAVFGAGAIVTWLFLIAMTVQGWRKLFGKSTSAK